VTGTCSVTVVVESVTVDTEMGGVVTGMDGLGTVDGIGPVVGGERLGSVGVIGVTGAIELGVVKSHPRRLLLGAGLGNPLLLDSIPYDPTGGIPIIVVATWKGVELTVALRRVNAGSAKSSAPAKSLWEMESFMLSCCRPKKERKMQLSEDAGNNERMRAKKPTEARRRE
jgi:hypothetical protein